MSHSSLSPFPLVDTNRPKDAEKETKNILRIIHRIHVEFPKVNISSDSVRLSCTYIIAKCYSFWKSDEVVCSALKCRQVSHAMQLFCLNHSFNSVFLMVKEIQCSYMHYFTGRVSPCDYYPMMPLVSLPFGTHLPHTDTQCSPIGRLAFN